MGALSSAFTVCSAICLTTAIVATPTGAEIVLAPAIDPPAQAQAARGVFFDATTRVTLPSDSLLLAGSADGRGELCTDDEARITFRTAGAEPQVWTRRFADEGQGEVVCLPPQRLTLNAGAGTYLVEVMLIDRYPPVYGSHAYVLIPLDTPSPETTPTRQDAAAPSAAPPATARPSATAPAAASHAPGASPAAPSPSGVNGPATLVVPALLACAALLALLAVLARKLRRSPPTLSGVLDLLDRDSGERRTALLVGFPAGASLARRPLELRRLDDTNVDERVIATLRPSRAGPELHVTRSGATPLTYQLRSGERLLVAGTLELRYRAT